MATIKFSLELTGDGETASLSAPASGVAEIEYVTSNAENSAVEIFEISNGDADFFTLSADSSSTPPALTLKALTLLEKISSLSPDNIIGNGGKFKIELAKQDGSALPIVNSESNINAIEGVITVKDLVRPEISITDASYDQTNTRLILDGAGFLTIDGSGNSNSATLVDTSKITWNGASLSELVVSSVTVASDSQLVIDIDSASADLIHNITEFAGSDLDTLQVSSGAIRDLAGNGATFEGTVTRSD